MNRLIQGDVGSGKTIIAILALLEAAYNGYQGALMVPTEVLARQHYESMTSLFQAHGITQGTNPCDRIHDCQGKAPGLRKNSWPRSRYHNRYPCLIREKVVYDNLAW